MIDSYQKLALKSFGWIPDRYPELFIGVGESLPKSGLAIPTRNYVSIICLLSFIGFLFGIVIAVFLNFYLKLNVFTGFGLAVFFPIILGIIVFFIGYSYPIQQVMSRRANIDTNLPFAIAHIGAIVASGIPPSAVFKLLAKFKEYDILAEEMRKIVTNMEVFGLDPVSAMREVAKRTPSEKLKQLLFGFVSTIESGGDLKIYLRNMGEQNLFNWRMKRQKYIQQLSTYAEFYTGLLIAAPLFIISLFSVMNMIEPNLGGFGILQLMKLSIYILIPLLNIGFIVFLHSTQVEI
jgi:flagellar protein FlaJ